MADEKPEKCFITMFYNDNENMHKNQLCHLTVDSILLTSQEISMTEDHLHLEYPCTCLHQGKRRLRNNLCNRGQLAQSSEMSTWSDAGAMWELVRPYLLDQAESVCCTLRGGVQIQMNGWWFTSGKAAKIQRMSAWIPHPLTQVNPSLGHRKVFVISVLCCNFHNELTSLNL